MMLYVVQESLTKSIPLHIGGNPGAADFIAIIWWGAAPR